MANYDGYMQQSPMVANIYDTLQGTMVFLPLIYGYADRNPYSYAGYLIRTEKGILTTQFYGGYLTSAQTETKVVYRTVGSPRKRPLESAWTHSKDAEAFIIDEVDGDVDE